MKEFVYNVPMKQTRGRPKAFDEDIALELAMNYFWEHGYDNASMDNLLIAMGIKKSSFYNTFESKEVLFSRVLDLYRRTMLEQFEQLRQERGAKATLLALPTFTIEELRATGKVRGCLMSNSAQECYNKYSDLSHQIRVEFEHHFSYIQELIREAQALGDVSDKHSSKILAGRYINMLNGLIVIIQAGADEEVIADVVESLNDLLE